MPQRRRYATREELHELLAGRGDGIDWPAVLAALEQMGVDVAALIKGEAREEV